MKPEEAAELARLKASIQSMLNGRVPESLSEASVQRVRDFKAAVEGAKKASSSAKPTLQRLQQAHNVLAIFYQGEKRGTHH